MEKSSSKKRKKRSKRRSCSSSSDKDKRRLKENKQDYVASKSGENLSSNKTLHREHDRGESSDRRTKKSKNSSKKKAKVVKKKYSSSSDGSSSLSESETEKERRKRRKHEKKERKKRKKENWEKELIIKKRVEFDKDRKEEKKENGLKNAVEIEDLISGPMPQPEVPTEETSRKRLAMIPMTKEEYEKQQSKVRRVFDPDTGRNRLVKGDGEIVEEAVSYQRHKDINKLATLGDGASFQKSLGYHKHPY